MAKFEINAETVAAAAEAVVAEGKTPTQTNVRDKIGGGSFTTIKPFFNEWKRQKDEEKTLEAVEVPDTISEEAAQLVAKLWTAAMAEATAGHEAMRKKLVEADEKTEEIIKDHNEVVQSLESDSEANVKKIEELSFQIDEMNKKVSEQDKQIIVLNERLTAERERAERAEASNAELVKAIGDQKKQPVRHAKRPTAKKDAQDNEPTTEKGE
jgi:hypothetical protein